MAEHLLCMKVLGSSHSISTEGKEKFLSEASETHCQSVSTILFYIHTLSLLSLLGGTQGGS